MEFIKKILIPLIFGVSLLTVTFVVGLELIIFNEPYFEWHYEQRNVTQTTEMSLEDLMIVTVEMLDYLEGQRPNLDMTATIAGEDQEVFGQREKAHMVDVRDLYLGFRTLRRIGSVVVILTLLAGWFFSKETLYYVLNRVKYIVPSLLLVVGAVGLLFATDFNKYFTLFHHIFFDNDLWLLNPKTDILINMVPETYFYSIVMIGMGLFTLMIVVSILIASRAAKKLSRTR